MDLVLCRTLWGLEDEPARYALALPAIGSEGYDAVACPVQLIDDLDSFANALSAARLELLPQLFTFGRTVDDHLAMFRSGLERTRALMPRHVVCQAGRDGWAAAASATFFREAVAIAAGLGATVAFETHRGRSLCNPWITATLVEAVPDLLLAADLSHWVCVGETLDLPSSILEAIAPRVIHIDARVGFEQGPQVADPAAPRFAEHADRFERWWDLLWQTAEAAGRPALSMTAEYGPPPYQPIDPYTGKPARELSSIVADASAGLRLRYSIAREWG